MMVMICGLRAAGQRWSSAPIKTDTTLNYCGLRAAGQRWSSAPIKTDTTLNYMCHSLSPLFTPTLKLLASGHVGSQSSDVIHDVMSGKNGDSGIYRGRVNLFALLRMFLHCMLAIYYLWISRGHIQLPRGYGLQR